MRLESESNFAAAAEIWEVLVDAANAPDEREIAVYRAQQARRVVAASTGDVDQLCRARDVVARFLGRADLEEETRSDFDGFAREIGRALEDLGERCELRPATAPPAASASTVSTGGESGPTPPPAPAATISDAPSSQRDKALAISGGVLVGAGAVLAGIMTYGLVEDARAAEEILGYVSKNKTTGLTMDEAAGVTAAKHRSDVGSSLAIAAGISGGAALVTGIALLVAKTRRDRVRRAGLDLQPALGPAGAGLVLRGAF